MDCQRRRHEQARRSARTKRGHSELAAVTRLACDDKLIPYCEWCWEREFGEGVVE